MSNQVQRSFSRLSKSARPLARTLFLCLGAATAHSQARTILHRTSAEYPPLAEKMRISGTVTVLATVEPSGSVAGARAIAGHAMLRPAAEKAVMQWKFTSAAKAEETNIDIQFQLRGEGTR